MLLKLGMSGPEVANLERVIEALGFADVSVDGVFDNKLENVIKYIQKSHNLIVDGKAGDKTLAVIDVLYEPGVNNFSSSTYVPESAELNAIGDPTRKLNYIHPILARKARDVMGLALKEGYKLVVTQGLRTFDEQHKLFLQRPKVTNADAGESYHNYGVAVDLAFVVDGKLSWEERLYKNIGRWANQIGLTWGGNWKFVDYPHVQLANMPSVRKMKVTYLDNKHNPLNVVWNKYVGN